VVDLTIPLATLLPHSIGPYIAVMLSGFALGAAGHMSRTPWLVAAGIVLVFLGAFLLPVALNVTTDTPPHVENSPSP
jgi:hypothetical protein